MEARTIRYLTQKLGLAAGVLLSVPLANADMSMMYNTAQCPANTTLGGDPVALMNNFGNQTLGCTASNDNCVRSAKMCAEGASHRYYTLQAHYCHGDAFFTVRDIQDERTAKNITTTTNTINYQDYIVTDTQPNMIDANDTLSSISQVNTNATTGEVIETFYTGGTYKEKVQYGTATTNTQMSSSYMTTSTSTSSGYDTANGGLQLSCLRKDFDSMASPCGVQGPYTQVTFLHLDVHVHSKLPCQFGQTNFQTECNMDPSGNASMCHYPLQQTASDANQDSYGGIHFKMVELNGQTLATSGANTFSHGEAPQLVRYNESNQVLTSSTKNPEVQECSKSVGLTSEQQTNSATYNIEKYDINGGVYVKNQPVTGLTVRGFMFKNQHLLDAAVARDNYYLTNGAAHTDIGRTFEETGLGYALVNKTMYNGCDMPMIYEIDTPSAVNGTTPKLSLAFEVNTPSFSGYPTGVNKSHVDYTFASSFTAYHDAAHKLVRIAVDRNLLRYKQGLGTLWKDDNSTYANSTDMNDGFPVHMIQVMTYSSEFVCKSGTNKGTRYQGKPHMSVYASSACGYGVTAVSSNSSTPTTVDSTYNTGATMQTSASCSSIKFGLELDSVMDPSTLSCGSFYWSGIIENFPGPHMTKMVPQMAMTFTETTTPGPTFSATRTQVAINFPSAALNSTEQKTKIQEIMMTALHTTYCNAWVTLGPAVFINATYCMSADSGLTSAQTMWDAALAVAMLRRRQLSSSSSFNPFISNRLYEDFSPSLDNVMMGDLLLAQQGSQTQTNGLSRYFNPELSAESFDKSVDFTRQLQEARSLSQSATGGYISPMRFTQQHYNVLKQTLTGNSKGAALSRMLMPVDGLSNSEELTMKTSELYSKAGVMADYFLNKDLMPLLKKTTGIEDEKQLIEHMGKIMGGNARRTQELEQKYWEGKNLEKKEREVRRLELQKKIRNAVDNKKEDFMGFQYELSELDRIDAEEDALKNEYNSNIIKIDFTAKDNSNPRDLAVSVSNTDSKSEQYLRMLSGTTATTSNVTLIANVPYALAYSIAKTSGASDASLQSPLGTKGAMDTYLVSQITAADIANAIVTGFNAESSTTGSLLTGFTLATSDITTTISVGTTTTTTTTPPPPPPPYAPSPSNWTYDGPSPRFSQRGEYGVEFMDIGFQVFINLLLMPLTIGFILSFTQAGRDYLAAGIAEAKTRETEVQAQIEEVKQTHIEHVQKLQSERSEKGSRGGVSRENSRSLKGDN